jgi:SAM-dependent methyltransferase
MLPLSRQNAYRDRYQKRRPGWRPSGAEFEALVRRRIQPTTRVLDVGCGRGGVMELFWRGAALPVGLDPDLRSLREHRTLSPLLLGEGDDAKQRGVKGSAMPRVCGWSERLPFENATFDLVLALWLLEHLPRPQHTLIEIARVLRPDGYFLFLTPNALHPLIVANRGSQLLPAVQRALVPRLYGRTEADIFRVHYRANTPDKLRALAAACGFRVASLRAIPDPSYLAFNDFFFELSVLLENALPRSWGVHLIGEWVKAAGG